MNVFFGVGGAQECGLELRWRQVHAVVQHGAKEAGKGTFRFSVPDSSRKEGAVSEPRWPAA